MLGLISPTAPTSDIMQAGTIVFQRTVRFGDDFGCREYSLHKRTSPELENLENLSF